MTTRRTGVKRSRYIGIRLSEDEWKAVQRRRQGKRETISGCIRRLIAEPIPTPEPVLPPPAPIPVPTFAPSSTPSPVVTRFMVTFYRTYTPERRADVSRQMTAALLTKGVDFQGSVVRAVDMEHLDDMLLEVMEEPPRDPNAAWVFVLAKLRETYTEVTSARAKALDRATARVRLPEGMAGEAPAGATPIRAALAGVLDGLDASRGAEADGE